MSMVGLSACSSEAGDDLGPIDPRPPDNTSEQSLRFEHEGTIALSPGETREITVIGTTPADYAVSFTLHGDVIDGSLDHSLVSPDPHGRARVILRAPSQATTFQLRAAIVGPDGVARASISAGVAVSDQGFGKVRVVPVYKGKRQVTEWTASVAARTTCADLAPLLPGEPTGALVAEAKEGDAPLVDDAPVGPKLAVTLRAGHYLVGCADTTLLKADNTLEVKVVVVDVPIALAKTNLDLSFDFTPQAESYGKLLLGATNLMTGALVPPGQKDATALLDAMAALASPTDATAFAQDRVSKSWDDLVSQHLSALNVDLRALAAAWATAGLGAQAPEITARLEPKPSSPGVMLVVEKLGSVDAADAGVPSAIPFSLTAEPDDRLVLGGNVVWLPSRFVCAAAFAAAEQDVPGAASMAEALAKKADCVGLGASMGGFGACDSACAAALCQAALGARWAEARDASLGAGQVGSITMTASGYPTLGDEAEPTAYSGIWVGSVTSGMYAAQVSGNVVGTQTTP